MATPPFDDRGLKALKVESGRVELADPITPGLRFRKTAKQTTAQKPPYGSFSVVYRIRGGKLDGKQDRKTLSPAFPLLSVAEARAQARDILTLAGKGEDPKEEQSDDAAPLTFGQLFEDWLARHGRNLVSGRSAELMIRKQALPAMGHIPADSAKLIRGAAITISDRIEKEGKVIAARRFLATLSSVFHWGIGRNLVDGNPITGVVYPGQENPGTRVLSEPELRALLLHLLGKIEGYEAPRPNDAILTACAVLSRVMLGQRTTEILAMAHQDLEPSWWNLPREITKTQRAHRVFLIPPWLELVYPVILAASRGKSFCFSGMVEGKALHHETVTKFVGTLQGTLGFHFTARDLRRTYVTTLARLGIARETRMRMVNHRIPGIDQRHYDLHDYDQEKRAAALVFDAYLRKILYGEEAAVLPFPASAKL